GAARAADPQAGGRAERAGTRGGDVIPAMTGTRVREGRVLARHVAQLAPGSSVKFDVRRDGASKSITLTLGELPNDRQAKADTEQHAAPTAGVPHLGLQLAPAAEVEGAGNQGVAVVGVEQGSRAAERGLQTGDVILEVGGKQVAKPADVRDALIAAQKAGRSNVLMRVKTADAATRFVAVPLG